MMTMSTNGDVVKTELESALRATLKAVEVIDFSPINGVYDSIPWTQIETALECAEKERQ
jgi:hypothetical protein